MKPIFWILTIISAFCLIFAQITLKLALRPLTAEMFRQNAFRATFMIARQPWFWLSISLSAIVFALTIYNLVTMPLSKFVPIYIIIYYLGLLFMSIVVLNEGISMQKGLGYILLVAAMFLISKSR